MATVQALATALETKDEYTGEHANQLESLCLNVAIGLGLDGQELRDITLGAVLHDIGKIGIPSPILNKPAPLTEPEWEVMRRHPELGARIIEPVASAGRRPRAGDRLPRALGRQWLSQTGSRERRSPWARASSWPAMPTTP